MLIRQRVILTGFPKARPSPQAWMHPRQKAPALGEAAVAFEIIGKLRKTEHAEHSPTIFGCKDYREKQLTLPARSLPADSCFQSVW
jgi:hypothetical protein